MKTRNQRRTFKHVRSFVLISAFIIAVAIMAVPFYSVRSKSLRAAAPANLGAVNTAAASASGPSRFAGVRTGVGGAASPSKFANDFGSSWISESYAGRGLMALAALQSGSESIVVNPPTTPRPAGCTDPDVRCLGETVSATVTNAPLRADFRERRIQWIAPDGTVPQMVDVLTDPQTDTYTLQTTGSFAQVGTWTVRTITNRGGGVAVATFEVGDPTQPSVDLAISVTGPADVTASTNVSYNVIVTNNGPDSADNVTVLNPVPYNTTFVSALAPAGFSCTTPNPGEVGDILCSGTSLALNASAAFTFTFAVNSDVRNGIAVYEYAKTGTSTNEPNTSNNIGYVNSTSAPPSGGGGTCTLDCPEDINAIADTEEGGQRGAHVTFSATNATGDCGTVTTTPASGSFFPVGTTTVTSTSELNGGSCSFTITVEDQGINPPTISCPANPPAANANGDCEAVVTIANPTVSGNNVTFSGVRSDGKPMYNCDCFPHNPDPDPNAPVWECDIHGACTRRADAPFASGTTTITWTAHSHDVPGPYPNPDFEEAHRTGAASCTVTVTVNDTTPPVITAVDSTVSADANCQAAVPDYSNSVSDNCSCAANDNSQDCVGQHRISTTQDVPAGTMLGPGSYTIHLTANDGSSNNGGAGNTTTKDIVFTVKDTTAPTINCPANITANTDPGTCSATVNPGTATATDNCDTSPTVVGTRSDNQPLNAPYPKGTTTITWTATDHASPANHSSCQQTITVQDHEPPTISCQANIIVDFDPAVNGAVVTYTAPVGVDNCGGATTARTAGLASGAVFPVGTTTNTFRVTDASGNFAECSFKVTVALTSIIGLDSVTITGSGYADSYSSAGGYPATKGSLANMLSNGTITIGNSGKVWGNVRSTRANVNMTGSAQVTGNATAGTTVTTSGSATVGGTRTNNALAPVMTLPSVPACGPPYSPNSGISGTYSYNASTGDLTVNGTNIATLANGNYCFHNVTLGNSGQLKVNGLVVIKLTGTLNTSGATNLNNTTQIPSNLRILSSYSGSNGVILGNGVSVYALIYAPNTGLNLSGSAPLFGTFAGKSLIIGNSGAIHYDTQLKSVWPDVWVLIFGP